MYNIKQEMEIERGKCSGVDTEIYAKEYFTYKQMELIREGLEDGLGVEAFAKPELSYDQMFEISEGLRNRVDVTLYNHEFNHDYLSAEHMRYIRLALENSANPEFLLNADLSIYQVEEIYEGLISGVDVSIFAYPWVDDSVMAEMREALASGEEGLETPAYVSKYAEVPNINLEPYIASGEFNEDQIQQIRLGLEFGVDVKVYAKPELNWLHMSMIRLGLMAEFDMRRYANPDYDWRQVEQILKGLKDDLEVSKYDIPNFYWADMRTFRKELEHIKYVGPYSA